MARQLYLKSPTSHWTSEHPKLTYLYTRKIEHSNWFPTSPCTMESCIWICHHEHHQLLNPCQFNGTWWYLYLTNIFMSTKKHIMQCIVYEKLINVIQQLCDGTLKFLRKALYTIIWSSISNAQCVLKHLVKGHQLVWGITIVKPLPMPETDSTTVACLSEVKVTSLVTLFS